MKTKISEINAVDSALPLPFTSKLAGTALAALVAFLPATGLNAFATLVLHSCRETRRGFGNAVAAVAIIACLLIPTALLADYTSGDYTYTVSNSKATITDYTGSATELTIPDTIDGYTVTSIGDYAFYFCLELTSITIPDGVTSIGDGAFYYCTSLTSITIGSGVTSIGNNAFGFCTSLTSITIPDNVTVIGYEAFYYCTSLTSITIPNGVTSIEYYTFFRCTSMTNLTIGNGVTSLGYAAFAYCTSLTSVTIPDGVTSIGGWAFGKCTSLVSITIPDSVTTIENAAFENCTSLTSVSVDPNNACFTSVDGALYDKDKQTLLWVSPTLTSFTIPDSVTSIGYAAFESCTSLASITIPDNVTTIGNLAFYGCTSLTSVTIPDNVTSIGSGAFGGCTSLNEIAVDPENSYFASLNGALYDKLLKTLVAVPSAFTGFTIPDSVTSIESGAFWSCTSLTSITIPDSVTSIGDYAFRSCTSLVTAVFYGDAPTMGSYVFYNAASGFCIYYPASATGYDVSPWTDYTLYSYTITEGPSWSDSTESITSPGWYDSDWYSWFYTEDSWGGWIYSEINGWQYVYDLGGDDGIVVYDNATGDWWFTSKAFYPYVYDYANSTWLFYSGGTTPSREFFNYATSSLVDESSL